MTERKKDIFIISLKWTLKVLFVLFVILFLIAYANIGKLVLHFLDTGDIQNLVKKNTGLELFFDTPDLFAGKDLSISLKTKQLKISDPDTSYEIIATENLNIKIKLFPLLFKKIEFKYLEADNIKLNIERDRNGVFNFSKYIKKDEKFPFKLEFKDAQILVDSYTFTFDDKVNNVISALKGDAFLSDSLDFNNLLSFKTKGVLVINNAKTSKETVSSYSVDANVKLPLNENADSKKSSLTLSLLNVRLESLLPYIKEYVYKDINELSGISSLYIYPYKNEKKENMLDVKADLNNIKLALTKDKKKSTVNIKGKSSFATIFSFNKNDITIKNMSFLSDGINIKGNGLIKSYSTKNINPDINIEIIDSELNNLLFLLPENLIKLQQDYIPQLKKYNSHAIVRGKLNIKDRIKYPNVYGKLFFDDVWIIDRPDNAKTSEGTCEFSGNVADIFVKVNAPKGEYVAVYGTTEIGPKPLGKFTIKSTENVDMAFAHKLLIPVHNIIGFKLGPLPFMTIAGKGKIELETEGTKDRAKLNGYFLTNNGTATLEGINSVLTQGRLKLVFDDDKIIYNNTKGKIEGTDIFIDGVSDVNGNIDLSVKVPDVNAVNALNVAKTSDMVLDLLNGGEFLNQFMQPTGKVDFNLHIKGKVTEFGDMNAMDNMDTNGSIVFKNNSMVIFPHIKTSKITGILNFSKYVDLDLNANIYNSPFRITGTITPDFKASKNRKLQPQIVDLTFKSRNVKSVDIFDFFKDNGKDFNPENYMSDGLYNILKDINFVLAGEVNAKGKVLPTDKTLDLRRFNLNGWAVGLNSKTSDVIFNSGNLKFKGQSMLLNAFDCILWGANVRTEGAINNIFDTKFSPDLNFKLKSFPVEKLNAVSPLVKNKNASKILSDFNAFKGYAGGDFYLEDKNFRGKVNFYDISFYDKKRQADIKLNSGDVRFSNNSVDVNALNMMYGKTPVYFDANIKNISDKPYFNAYLSTNLNEESVDKFINPLIDFPLKAKGEFTLKGRMRGNVDKYTLFTTVSFNPLTDISYMGANLGDVESKREISSRLEFDNNTVKINKIRYFKYILSQNNKQTPYDLINATGSLSLKADNVLLNDIRLYTPNPAPARLLNLFFKKSILKQGTFISDINVKGSLKAPVTTGKLAFSNINIPLYDVHISDIDLNLGKNYINGTFTGKGFESDIKMDAQIQNKPGLPLVIDKLDVTSNKITVSKVMEGLADIAGPQKSAAPGTIQPIAFKPSDFIINKGKIKADVLQIYDIRALNFTSDFSHTKEGIKFDNTSVDIAGGKIKGSGSYNFDTTKLVINSVIENCDANALASDIFGMKNQIFGKSNGTIYLTGKELNTAKGLGTVEANVDFAIYDGKMPKLGSLEYLLRAGNLLKSGILGFTINNVVEILIPYKTGEFKKIAGSFRVENGIVESLNVYSQGENLSTYTHGTYDISTNVGSFEILGKLSKKVSNLLGPIGNTSVNSILSILTNTNVNKITKEAIVQNLNKIPAIDYSNDDFRLFAVKILGDINKEGYVRSFNWLN